jgi:hypothetical protein
MSAAALRPPSLPYASRTVHLQPAFVRRHNNGEPDTARLDTLKKKKH